jgi:transposase
MLDQTTRTTILKLHEAGHGTRAIARALGISRGGVKKVIASRSPEVPPLERAELAEPHRERILELFENCRGNLVRVHEELLAGGARLSYPALTAFCRRHAIGCEPREPAGEYCFVPGQEMQHDTSPHDLKLGGRVRRVQTASLVLCHSRMLFFQHYPRFDRFACKVFLTDALTYIDGACEVCMIDNTHVVVASGTGRDMVPAPEMAAFAERLRFKWRAHEKGDANRSGRVERPFHYIENNFLAGREFPDWETLNREARLWCDKVNATHKRHLHAAPRELFAAEKPHLRRLPVWVPEVYALHQRIVDVEGFVNLHRNRYSAPWRLIGRSLEVRETKERIEIFHGPRRVASHKRLIDGEDLRVVDPAHRPPRGEGRHARGVVSPEETELLRLAPELADYLARLKRHAQGRSLRGVRRLLRMVSDYPRGPLLESLRVAAHYGLFDLERVERMLLRSLARDFFFVSPDRDRDPDPNVECDHCDDEEDPDDR